MAETNLLMSGRAQYADPAPADDSVIPLSFNRDGRLRVASKQVDFSTTSAALATAGNAFTVDVADASNVVCHVKNTGSAAMVAGAFAFQGSIDSTNGVDGTWFALQAVRSNSNTVETNTGALGLAPASGMGYSWELSVNAIRWFRILTTTTLTTNAVATWIILPGSYATEPIPAVQTHPITGTVDISGTVPVSGTVGVSGTVPVSGTVGVTGTVTTAGTSTVTPTQPTGYALTTAASTNANVVKASPGNLFETTVTNTTGATIYVKYYNKATAPTVGTDVPLFVQPVNASAAAQLAFGTMGKRFSTGIAIAVTGALVTSDTTAVAAGALVSMSYL